MASASAKMSCCNIPWRLVGRKPVWKPITFPQTWLRLKIATWELGMCFLWICGRFVAQVNAAGTG